jgi:FtsH-binding integral membrane protein
MSDKKISFRDEIKMKNQKTQEEQALKDYKRNTIGLYFSAIVFFIVLLMTFNGIRVAGNLSTMLIVASMMGVFFFGRGLRVLPKGQIVFSCVKALLCVGMCVAYTILHQGNRDMMDYGILAILLGVVAVDIPRVIKASKEMKQ